MKSAVFDYARPKNLPEALKLLAEAGDEAKPMAGAQSMGPMLNLRVLQPRIVVDLRHIEELRATSENADAVTFGACTTHSAVEDGKVPDPTNGFMREVASNIAYRAVRNRGTMGGSLVHADPAADWPSTLLLLGATALIAGPDGRREVAMDDFITGIFETALKPGELLAGIRVPKLSKNAKRGYWKFCRKAGEFPQAIGGALDDPDRGRARAVIGATRTQPFAVKDAKALLKADKAAILAATKQADLGDDAYNIQLHAVALRRAVERMSA